MKMIDDINIECTTPMFLSKTTELLNHIQSLEYSELKSYLKCSDTIAQTTYDQFQNMSLNKNTTPAILSYSGIQYQLYSRTSLHYFWILWSFKTTGCDHTLSFRNADKMPILFV